jgi:RNA polymerase sigma factor (sigma-70 family)
MILIQTFQPAPEEKLSEKEASQPLAAPETPNPAQDVNWPLLVERIQANEAEALEELYALFSRGIKFMILRQLGRQDIEDRVHDTFVIVVQAIQRGDLREPARLMGFVRTIVRRQIANAIERNATRRREETELDGNFKVAAEEPTPEQLAIRTQNSNLMKQLLNECSARDREILTRFYLLEQSQEQICREMGISETQFRLLKSRAKQRFGEEGRRRLAQGNLRALFLRKTARP